MKRNDQEKMYAQPKKYWHHFQTCYSAFALSRNAAGFSPGKIKALSSTKTPSACNP